MSIRACRSQLLDERATAQLIAFLELTLSNSNHNVVTASLEALQQLLRILRRDLLRVRACVRACVRVCVRAPTRQGFSTDTDVLYDIYVFTSKQTHSHFMTRPPPHPLWFSCLSLLF